MNKPSKNQIIDIFLKPGDYFVGDARHRISTILGSCVSILLWHPVKRIGALSHFILFSRSNSPNSSSGSKLDGRYGDEAMSLMLHDLKLNNVCAQECHGKIFGGGNMFPKQLKLATSGVGLRNGEAARELLKSHHIRLVSEHLSGVGHRKIIFEVNTGDVWLRQFSLDETIKPETKDFI